MLATLSTFVAGAACALVAVGVVSVKFSAVFDEFIAFIRK